MLDGYGRNIDYLRVSVTDRCNMRCIYCMPEEGIAKKDHDEIIRFEEILKVIRICASLGIKKVRFTGGEPLILKDIDKLIYETSRISQITDIGITTNGTMLSDMAEDLKKCGLRRVNVSLDSLDRDKFKHITRGGDLGRVLKGIDAAIKYGLQPVKINTVVIKGINDNEIDDFIKMADEMPVHIRFIELMPIGEGQRFFRSGMLPSEEIIKNYPELIKLGGKRGSVAENYKMKNAKGTVGFITPLSCKFCSDCNRIRLTASGSIKPCLHSAEEIQIKNYMDNELVLNQIIKGAILKKPFEHKLETEEKSRSEKMMFQIGG